MQTNDKVMAAFWERMIGMYGATWSRDMGVQPPADGPIRDEWENLVAEMTPDQIRCGFNEARMTGSDWPPTVPRFRAMCFGIPSLAAVQLELDDKHDGERSPFARLAWGYVDRYKYRHASLEDCRKMVAEAFSMAREHVMRGGKLPEVVAVIAKDAEPPKPPPVPASRETAKAHLDQIRSILGGNEETGTIQ